MKKSTEMETTTDEVTPDILLMEGIEFMIKGRLAQEELKRSENQASMQYNIDSQNALADLLEGRRLLQDFTHKVCPPPPKTRKVGARMVIDPAYTLVKVESGRCHECGGELMLLMALNGAGQGFYICFGCRSVYSVGGGIILEP